MKDTNMDYIRLIGIELWTPIGVPKEERAKAQRVLVDLTLVHPTKSVGKSDDIATGINYQDVTHAIIALAARERKTIERLAEDIAIAVLERYKPQGGVEVTVHKKPDLPLEEVSVTIHRP